MLRWAKTTKLGIIEALDKHLPFQTFVHLRKVYRYKIYMDFETCWSEDVLLKVKTSLHICSSASDVQSCN